ncbi:hypothetical protein [Luteolibacter marinus]|uniref:hypothetical protein n=1 Tax=Luteolibacter marinus TaxID=2776705 RepID=UPI001868426F|nr:hypothetical protein [Luteolibacter marinus]
MSQRGRPGWRILLTGLVLVLLVAFLLRLQGFLDPMMQGARGIPLATVEPLDAGRPSEDEPRSRRKLGEAASTGSARIRSMLEVRNGEVGLMRIDGGSFGLPDIPGGLPPGISGVSALLNRETSAAILQRVESEGNGISGILGAGDSGVEWQGEHLNLKVTILRFTNEGRMADLQVEIQEKGEKTMVSWITVAVGYSIVVRSGNVDPEELMIVVGGDDSSEEIQQEDPEAHSN